MFFSLAETATGEQLTPPARAAILMALLGIALLGLLIIVVVLLGGHWVRRIGSHRRGPSVPPDRSLLREKTNGSPSMKGNDHHSSETPDAPQTPSDDSASRVG